MLEPLTRRHTDLTIDDAYRIQQRLNARRVAAGERIIGKKIGVINSAEPPMIMRDTVHCLTETEPKSETPLF